jgi:hypothetical protein
VGKNDRNNNGYEDGDENESRTHILELCKLAQGNITTIYWCKQQIKKRLKVLDRLINRLKGSDQDDQKKQIEFVIKKQTNACKELGEKIKLEIESLDAIRVAAKAYGIDIKTRLLELDDSLSNESIDEFFGDDIE